MVMYNTLMGVCAGIALIYVSRFWAVVLKEPMPLMRLGSRKPSAIGWAFTFGVLGFVLTVLGGMMTLTWPLTAKPYINTPFGEPSFLLGVILLATAWLLSRTDSETLDEQRLRDVLTPVSTIIFWSGVVLVFCVLAITRFDVVSGALEWSRSPDCCMTMRDREPVLRARAVRPGPPWGPLVPSGDTWRQQARLAGSLLELDHLRIRVRPLQRAELLHPYRNAGRRGDRRAGLQVVTR